MTTQIEKSPLFIELHTLVEDGLEQVLKGLSDEERRVFFESNNGEWYDNFEVPLERIAGTFLEGVNKQARIDYRKDKGYKRGFEKRLGVAYQPYIIEFYGLLNLCIEAINHHREYIADQKIFKNKKHRARYSVVIRLHARALRICNEIRSLMESGYGTGALSRWRALHELATTISFLVKSPDATELFLEHGKVLSYDAMVDYNKYSDLLKHTPYTNSEVSTARRVRDNLVKKYGKEIKQPYGWLGVYSDGRLRNFRDMEQESGQKHLRPYYRYASYGIHANVKSLFSGEDFNALEENNILLVGASDGGMTEVAQLTPISIVYSTVSILTGISPNAGSIIAANTVLLKQEQLAKVFERVEFPDVRANH